MKTPKKSGKTKHAKTDKALLESEQRFKTLAEATFEGITISENGVIVDLNDQHAFMHGYDREELVGKRIQEIVAPESRERLAVAMRSGESGPVEYLDLRKDGTSFPVEVLSRTVQIGRREYVIAAVREITERKKSEETLQNERNLLRTLIDNIPDAIYVKDKKCRKVISNAADVRNIGRQSEAEVIGKDDFEMFPKELAEGFFADDRTVLETGTPVTYREEYVFDEKGKKLWLLTSKLPLRDSKGDITGLVGIGRNITEQKEAQEALRTSEAHLSNAMKMAKLGHWEYDVAKDTFTFNDNFYGIFRTTADREGGYAMSSAQYAKRFVHPDDAPLVGMETRKAIETTDPNFSRQLEHRMIYADGEIGYIAVRFFIVKDEHGQTIKTYGVNQDITERKRMEEVLEAQAEQYSAILATTADGFWLTDETGRLIDVNEACCRMTGYSREELLRLSITDLEAVEAKDESARHIRKIMENGSDRFETKHRTKDGQIIDVEVSTTYLTSKGWLLVFTRDITERKRTEAALRTSEAQLSNAVKMAHLGHWEYDVVKDLFTFNDHFYDIFRTTADQEGGYTMSSAEYAKRFVHPDDALLVDEEVRKAIEAPDRNFNEELEHRMIYKDGTVGYIAVRFYIVKDERGRTIKTFGVNQDITERKRAEETLASERNLLRTLIDTLPDHIYVKDADGRFLLNNTAHMEALGADAQEEVIGKTDFDFQQSEFATEPFTDDQNVIRTGTPVLNREDARLFPTGATWLSSTKVPLHDPQGKVVGMVAIEHDITDQKWAQEALRTSEAHLSNALKMAKLGHWAYDVAKDLFTFNDHFYGIFRTTADREGGYEMSSARYAGRFVHPEDAPQVADEIRKAIESPDPDFSRQLEHRIIYADGEVGYIAVRFNIIKDEQGRTIKTYGVNQDITEIKRAEEKIAEQARLLDVALDPIILRDMSDTLVYWNKAAEHLYGWSFEEAKALRDEHLIAEEEHSRYDRAKREFLEKGECEIELHQKAKNGRSIITHSRWTLVRNDDGTPRGRLIISRDQTDQRNLEAQLRRAQRLESLGTLAGGIAHDLNNMLAPILMAVQILNAKTSDANLKKLIGSLESSTKRGSEVIKQVLTFARGTEQDFAPQQIRYVFSEIESIIKETFPRNIQLRTGISKDLSLVLGDATQLHQVLINLCVNARDAMPEGGRLTLAAEDMVMDESYARMMLGAHPGRYVMLTVADTGTGIPKDIQDKIFEPFFTTKEKGKGTGLGLSTVYAIVKSHHGLIKLYSEVGKGTEFKIFLPVIQKEEKEKSRPASEGVLLKAKGERVLVIDDELSVLQISKEILETQGYTVMTAADGAEATALFAGAEKGSIKLVITDMNMPLMDGSSTIRALRRIDPALKIIVSSGLLTDVTSAGVTDLDIQGYMTKPYTSNQLLIMVQKVLTGGRSS